MKAYSVERAKMLSEDNSIEVVKVRMSRTHPRVDICDYHSSVNKYGLGAGVYPKHLAPIAPFHPYCRCRIVEDITRSAKGAKFNPKTDKEFMGKFNNYEKRLMIGSQRRVDSFLKSGDVMKSAVLGNPTYLRDVGGVKALGYNGGMEKFYKKYTKSNLGYEVGNISVVLASILQSESKRVILSDDTLTKNLNHHPDLKSSEYLLLDEIIGKSNFVAKDGDRTVAIVLQGNQLYHYALKSTKSGKALFLTSFRRTNKISIDKIRKKDKQKKLKIIKDNLP